VEVGRIEKPSADGLVNFVALHLQQQLAGRIDQSEVSLAFLKSGLSESNWHDIARSFPAPVQTIHLTPSHSVLEAWRSQAAACARFGLTWPKSAFPALSLGY
jgi:hypothetical protein